MLKCFIGIGNCSVFYFYILGSIILNAIRKIFFKNRYFVLNEHSLIQDIYKFFFFFVFGFLFDYILKNSLNKKKKNENENAIVINKTESSSLIFNENGFIYSKKDYFSFIIVCTIYVIYIEYKKILKSIGYEFLMFWTSRLAFTLLFMNHFFPRQLSKHQIYPMIFVIIFCTLEVIISWFLVDEYKKKFEEKGIVLCIIIILSYVCFTMLYSFIEVKIKVFMDLKYLRPYLIIKIIGIIGFFGTSIASLLFGFFGKDDCKDKRDNINCECNIFSYFHKLEDKLNSNKFEFYSEILIITPLYSLVEFLYITITIFIYKYLNPYYQLFSNNIYYLINTLFLFCLKSIGVIIF